MTDRQVQLQISTSQKYLPVHSTATIYLMLKIFQPIITLDTNRLPPNISFVLDRSGFAACPSVYGRLSSQPAPLPFLKHHTLIPPSLRGANI